MDVSLPKIAELDKTEQQYDDVIGEAFKIFDLKTKDYGTAWRILRPSSLTDQIFIKASRIRSIQEKQSQQVEEGVESEFIGIINYCIMAMVQLEVPALEGKYEMAVEDAIQAYKKYADITRSLMLRKNHDYGEAWRDMRVSSITDLILMKILRIKQIEENKGETLISEGLMANYQDMLNYAAFALILLSEEKN